MGDEKTLFSYLTGFRKVVSINFYTQSEVIATLFTLYYVTFHHSKVFVRTDSQMLQGTSVRVGGIIHCASSTSKDARVRAIIVLLSASILQY